MQQVQCNVIEISAFNDHVYKVQLKPEVPVEFKAGQYAKIIMGDNDKRPFSIASAPHQEYIEFHIGASVPESYPMQVIEKLKSEQQITIEIGAGSAHIRHDSQRPRLIIAGGTGFSYAKSIIEDLIHQQSTTETTLFWGCRNASSMYDEALARKWSKLDWLTFVPIVEKKDDNFEGKEGLLLDIVCETIDDFSTYDVYIAGRFDMSFAAKEKFLKQNINEEHLFGDAFSY